MKKIILFSSIVLLSLSLLSQQSFIEQALVINVEVPVRVFKGDKFMDGLTIKDFEVFEEGIPQKIEAVYLVKKRSIERSEERKRFSPQTSRTYFLIFEISEYTPRLGDALEFFVNNVLLPGDNLFIGTPMKTFRLKDNGLEIKSREEIADEIKRLLRKDAAIGNSEYRSVIDDITGLVRSLTSAIKSGSLDPLDNAEASVENLGDFDSMNLGGVSIDEQLMLYESLLQKLEILREVDQLKLLDFAKFLKYREGQKYVFLFYQREFIPQVDSKILDDYMSQFEYRPDILQTTLHLFNFYRRDNFIDVPRIKKAYADSSTAIHFLFIARSPKMISGVHMEEHSEDIYSSFKEMAKASGGFVDSSTNPVPLFKKALEASENYYLLYYSPKNYEADGKFKEIRVRIKSKGHRVIHRAGYFAN